MTEAKKTNLVQKLNEASSHIGPIAKDGKNSYQKYSFQSETAIKYAVESAIRDVGIRIIPQYDVINQYDKTSKKGGENHFVDVMGTFTITDGSDSIVGTMPGSGQDSGEKAMAKACTSAQKYFYKQLFNITDKDEDPDADDSNPDGGYQGNKGTAREQVPSPTPATPKQKSDLSSLFKEISEIINQDMDFVANTYLALAKVDSMDKLTHKQAQELEASAINKLNKLTDEGKKSA